MGDQTLHLLNDSRFLASGPDGGQYNTQNNSEAILIIDNRSWVIMYKIGTP